MGKLNKRVYQAVCLAKLSQSMLTENEGDITPEWQLVHKEWERLVGCFDPADEVIYDNLLRVQSVESSLRI